MSAVILTGDCRELMAAHGPFDLIIADPPYGETALEWDVYVEGWLRPARDLLKPTGSLWVFGSMRLFLRMAPEIATAGLTLAQDIVWEKHNGSGFRKDRFKRVHEHAVQFYRDDAPWEGVFNEVQTTPDAMAKTVRRKARPSHMGRLKVEREAYVSIDGGPRLMRSVIPMRSMHGRGIHPTEKPSPLVEILVRTSAPPPGPSRGLLRRIRLGWRGLHHVR